MHIIYFPQSFFFLHGRHCSFSDHFSSNIATITIPRVPMIIDDKIYYNSVAGECLSIVVLTFWEASVRRGFPLGRCVKGYRAVVYTQYAIHIYVCGKYMIFIWLTMFARRHRSLSSFVIIRNILRIRQAVLYLLSKFVNTFGVCRT